MVVLRGTRTPPTTDKREGAHRRSCSAMRTSATRPSRGGLLRTVDGGQHWTGVADARNVVALARLGSSPDCLRRKRRRTYSSLEVSAVGDYRCSFCGKRQDQVKKLIAGPTLNVMICDKCIVLCKEIIDEGPGAAARPEPQPRSRGWLDRLRRMTVALPR